MGSTLKINKPAYLPPGSLAIRRGKSLRAMGSVRVSAEQRTLIGRSKNFNASTSSQNESSVRVSAEQRTPIGQRKNFNASISSQNELTQELISIPPGFDPIEDGVHLHREVEVIQESQTNEISLQESEKSKKVRGKNIFKSVARLKPGEKLKVTFYQNQVVGKYHATFVRYLGILVRDRNMCPLRVHSWIDIKKDKLEHMWDAVTAKIQKLVQSDSSLTNIEVVEKCCGPQRKSHVVGFGGGITAKELKGGNFSKAALLDKLNAGEKENESLKRCMDELENKCERVDELERKYEQLASVVFGHHSSSPSSSER